ncbi:hypothetical protein Tco_1184638 [Tanacetum coccineum]
MSGTQDEIPPPPPHPQQTQQAPTQQQSPHTVSTIKLPTLKKGEYDIWAMKIEHYLAHTDYPIWEVIQNGNGPVCSLTSVHNTKHEQTSTSTSINIHVLLQVIQAGLNWIMRNKTKLMNKNLEEYGLEMASSNDLNENLKSSTTILGKKANNLMQKEPEENRRRDGWNTGNRDGNRTGKKEESKALVTVDGESIDWTTHFKNEKIMA